jgi:hypothetical protein
MQALHGIRVLELGSTVAGPFCGRLLADFGAEVVKVEPPAGDALRSMGKHVDGKSLYAASILRNKRLISVDLSKPQGRAVIKRLIPRFDIVIENFRPGTMEKWGLGSLATLDMTVEFARNKIVFGRPIGTNQAISFPLIEHYSRLEAARLLAYKALWMNDNALDAVREAAMAKWFGITSATQAISDCLQMHGANGYLTELPLEQKLRDVMALQFTGGTINVMKMLLVKDFLGKEFTGIY